MVASFTSAVLPTYESIQITLWTMVYLVAATFIIPGKYVQGVVLKDGKRISYKMNGTAVQLTALVLFFLLSDYGLFKLFRLTVVAEHYVPLLTTLLIFSLGFSFYLFLRAHFFLSKEEKNFHSSNPLAQFWAGGELNPFIFGLELKLFGYRPGLVFPTMVNISAIAMQYENYSSVSVPMIVFFLLNTYYAIDCFVFESGLIFMFDIIEENYGMMLCWGCYCWMPLVFSLQSVYLVDHPFEMSTAYVVFTFAVFILGFFLFRGANNQKIQFRQDPKKPIWGKAPQTIPTGRPGKDLLISGWWGVARKINYTGDILVAVAMSMPCRTFHFLPWLYPAYLFALLLHRATRDDAACRQKYGKVWEEYCKKVPSILIPGLY